MMVTASFSLQIPKDYQLKVKKDDVVGQGDLMAIGKQSEEVKEYQLAKQLNISPKRLFGCLLKKPGESIKEGELIVEKKNPFGKTKAKFVAPITGVFDSLTEEGILRLRLPSEAKEIKAPLAGQISIASKDKIEVAFAAQEIKADWGTGSPRIGTLVCLEKQKATLLDLTSDFKNKIVVISGSFNSGFWHKAVSLMLAGVVAASLADKNLEEFIQQENTSSGEASFSDGVGLPMLLYEEKVFPLQIWQKFLKNEGKKVLIEGEKKRILIPKQP